MNYYLIDNNQKLINYLGELWERNVRILALDLEAEYNLHAYGEKLGLVQVYDQQKRIIIDPLSISRGNLKSFFENERILKIMYDASSDLSLLVNSYDIVMKSIFDLRPAADLLNYEKKDLHSIINSELNESLEKKSKYQKYNWLRRPLDEDAIVYALNDVVHLFELKDRIIEKLYRQDLIEDFVHRNLIIQAREYRKKKEDRYRNVKGYQRLREKEARLFQKIFDMRDKYAERWNMPPNNLINKENLFRLARGTLSTERLPFPKRVKIEDMKRVKDEIQRICNG